MVVDNTTVIGTMGSTGMADPRNVHLHLEIRTALNVKLDEGGSYADFRRSPDDYWGDSPAELGSKWFDLGRLYGYSSDYMTIPAE